MLSQNLRSVSHPITFSDEVRYLANEIHCSILGRTDLAIRRLEDLFAEFEAIQQEYRGELLEKISLLLEMLQDILTCTDETYDAEYYNLWGKCEQIEREIVACYSKSVHIPPTPET